MAALAALERDLAAVLADAVGVGDGAAAARAVEAGAGPRRARARAAPVAAARRAAAGRRPLRVKVLVLEEQVGRDEGRRQGDLHGRLAPREPRRRRDGPLGPVRRDREFADAIDLPRDIPDAQAPHVAAPGLPQAQLDGVDAPHAAELGDGAALREPRGLADILQSLQRGPPAVAPRRRRHGRLGCRWCLLRGLRRRLGQRRRRAGPRPRARRRRAALGHDARVRAGDAHHARGLAGLAALDYVGHAVRGERRVAVVADVVEDAARVDVARRGRVRLRGGPDQRQVRPVRAGG